MNGDTLVRELRPILPVLVECVRRACAQYESFNISEEIRPIVDGAPRGITIWNLIWHFLRSHFGDEGDVRISSDNGLPVLLIQSIGGAIRVNKVDAGTLEGPVSKTPRTLQRHPQALFTFAEDDVHGHLVLGYTTRNDHGAVLDRVVLTLEGEGGVFWSRYIDSDDASGYVSDVSGGPEPEPPAVYPKRGEGMTSEGADAGRGSRD